MWEHVFGNVPVIYLLHKEIEFSKLNGNLTNFLLIYCRVLSGNKGIGRFGISR